MFNNFKTSLLRYRDMSWDSLLQLKQWMHLSRSFNSFDGEKFAASTLRIAQASNSNGDIVCAAPVETVYLVSAYAVNPQIDPTEVIAAAVELDSEIARQAQQAGVSKLLLIVPKDHPNMPEGEWKEVRIYERAIKQTVNPNRIGYSTPSQATQFLN